MTDTRLPGGPQSRRAAMMCQNARFCLYLDAKRRATHGMTHADLPDGTHTETDAAEAMRKACGVKIRAEIDHNDHARMMLDRIAADYQRWERAQLQRRYA